MNALGSAVLRIKKTGDEDPQGAPSWKWTRDQVQMIGAQGNEPELKRSTAGTKSKWHGKNIADPTTIWCGA